MLRITSGSARGKKLKLPDLPDFRAVQEKAKLAIFSILGDKVLEAKCLDLYAGSGNLGIEALSRGAAHCDFVDETRTAELTIQDNLKETGFENKAEVFRQDAIKFAANTTNNYDIVFVDPFYSNLHHKFLLEQLEKILTDNGVIIFSHGPELNIEEELVNTAALKLVDKKRYGGAFVSIIQKTQ